MYFILKMILTKFSKLYFFSFEEKKMLLFCKSFLSLVLGICLDKSINYTIILVFKRIDECTRIDFTTRTFLCLLS